jgi:hypothetical protein
MPRQFLPSELHPSEVEVCADCLRAECLDGINRCDMSYTQGDTDVMKVAYLRQLALESPEAWARDDARP